MIDFFALAAASTLISAIWQGAILATCVALCLYLLPGISAAFRSTIWSAVFCAVCALHFLPSRHQADALYTVHAAPQWSIALLCLWLGLSLFRAVQFGVAVHDLSRVLRRARPIAQSLAAPGVSRSYRICESPDVDRPSVLGFFSPCILLPPGLAGTLTSDVLNQVLLHEVEHLRRFDDWINLAQRVALILFPLNPVLLWVESRMCVERERACDDVVISTTGARKAYALCLTNLAERTMLQRGLTLALGAWKRKPELTQRVHRILSRPGPTMSPLALRATSMAVVGAVAFGFIGLARSPRLLSLVPDAVPTHMARLAQPAVSYPAQASFRTMEMPQRDVTPATVGYKVPHKHSRRITMHSAPRVNPASPRVDQRLSEPRMLLTTSSDESVQQFYVPAVIRMPVAYAAVATPDGWIIIQL